MKEFHYKVMCGDNKFHSFRSFDSLEEMFEFSKTPLAHAACWGRSFKLVGPKGECWAGRQWGIFDLAMQYDSRPWFKEAIFNFCNDIALKGHSETPQKVLNAGPIEQIHWLMNQCVPEVSLDEIEDFLVMCEQS